VSGQTWTSSDAPREASVKTRWMVEIRESDLSGTSRLVAWGLATWMNPDGWCYPSVPLIKKATKLGQRTVYDHLKILADNGFLTRTRGGGLGHSTQYQALLKGAAIAALIQSERVREKTERVRRGAQKGAAAGDREVTKKYPLRRGVGESSPNGDSPPEEPEGKAPPWAGIGWKQWREQEAIVEEVVNPVDEEVQVEP
jgi:DNA-binding transcriptional ArsR family regulator